MTPVRLSIVKPLRRTGRHSIRQRIQWQVGIAALSRGLASYRPASDRHPGAAANAGLKLTSSTLIVSVSVSNAPLLSVARTMTVKVPRALRFGGSPSKLSRRGIHRCTNRRTVERVTQLIGRQVSIERGHVESQRRQFR